MTTLRKARKKSAWERATKPLVVGHRGGRGPDWPAENTLDAFVRAHAEGADAIEFDVRACASGEIVIFHDEDLTRMTGGADTRRVRHVTFDELRAVPIGPRNAQIPLLADVLAWARGRVMANIEIKRIEWRRGERARWTRETLELARSVARVVRAHGRDDGLLFSSFDPFLLATMTVLAPRVPRAFLTHRRNPPYERAGEIVPPIAVFAAHIEHTQATPRFVARLQKRGLRVGVWTVNEPREAERLAKLGVDSIITDDTKTIARAIR